MLSTIEEVRNAVTPLIGEIGAKIEVTDFDASISQALLELNWSLPVEGSYAYWVIERTKRHVYWNLLSGSAHKFRYKEIFLQNRFTQYLQLVKMMDATFREAVEKDMEIFDTDVYPELLSYVTNGFVYDDLGRDLTYEGWL